MKRFSISDIQARKGQEPLVALTAYHKPMATLLDPVADILLVGDSLGMVLYGFDSTLPVSVDMMCLHGKAVVQASQRALVVVDMPFGSYEASKEQAFEHAARIMKATGAQAVKLEGGVAQADTIAFLTQRGIPVMGHVGLTPQHVHQFGGFKAQGKGDKAAKAIIKDAMAVADAGAFSMVLEGVYPEMVEDLVKAVAVPVIGIGASSACDGQILVSEDMLGLTQGYTPKFVRQYADIGHDIQAAVARYADDVRARAFPTSQECYGRAAKPADTA